MARAMGGAVLSHFAQMALGHCRLGDRQPFNVNFLGVAKA